MLTSIIGLAIYTYFYRRCSSETKALITMVGVWVLLSGLIGTMMVLLWGPIHDKALMELRPIFILAFGIGSMWLLLLAGSLYAILRVAHQSTDLNRCS